VTLHLNKRTKTHIDTTVTTDNIYDTLVEIYNSCCAHRHILYF